MIDDFMYSYLLVFWCFIFINLFSDEGNSRGSYHASFKRIYNHTPNINNIEDYYIFTNKLVKECQI